MTFQNNIVSNFTCLTAREIKYNNFEISLMVFMPNITTNHAIIYTNYHLNCMVSNSMDQTPVAQMVDNAIL